MNNNPCSTFSRRFNIASRYATFCLMFVLVGMANASLSFAQGKGKGGGGGGGDKAPDPTNLAKTILSTHEVNLQWNSSGGPTGGFIVAFLKDGTPRKKCTNGTQIDVGNVESVTITGLDYGSTYGIRVCAYDANGERSNGITVNATTPHVVDKNEVFPFSTVNDELFDIQVQGDGKIAFSGRASSIHTLTVARLNEDLTLDTSLSDDGYAGINNTHSPANDFTILDDGKYLSITGYNTSNGMAYLFNTDGTYNGEAPFVAGSYDEISARDVVELPNGKIFIMADVVDNGVSSILLARLNSDLSMDTSFGANGNVIHHYGGNTRAFNFAYHPSGYVVAAGDFEGFGFAARFSVIDGSEDYSQLFWDVDHLLFDVALDSQGGAIFSGRTDPFGSDPGQCEVLKLDANGNLDTSWANNGYFQFNYSSLQDSADNIAIDSQDRIYLAGNTHAGAVSNDALIIRLRPNGTIDTDWGDEGVVVLDALGENDFVRRATIDGQDRLVVGGVARLQQVSGADYWVFRLNK